MDLAILQAFLVGWFTGLFTAWVVIPVTIEGLYKLERITRHERRPR